MEKLIEKYKNKITQLQSKRNSFELKGMSGACVAITGEIQAYNAVLADLKRAQAIKQPTANANCAIFDVSNLPIMGLLKLMNEYNKKYSLNIGIGFYADGVGDICDYSNDAEICIGDFKTLNGAIEFLRE